MLPPSSSASTSRSSFNESRYVYDYLQKRLRGIGGHNRRNNNSQQERQRILQAVRSQSVAALTENPINLEDHDKIFASAWISSTRVVIGTKEDKLLLLNINDSKNPWTSIPLMKYKAPSLASVANNHQRVSRSTDARMTTSASRRTKGQRSNNAAEGNNSSNTAENDDDDDESNVYMREPITPTSIRQRFGVSSQHHEQQQKKKCEGIRSLSVNPSKTLLAVGLADPPIVMIYRLPELSPAGITARDHRDAVFSVQWLDDTTFVTGSRDGSLGLWKMDDNREQNENDDIGRRTVQEIPRIWASQTAGGFAPRIRDTKLTGCTTAASLAANGIVQIWDLKERQKQRNIKLWHTRELVCIATQQGNERGLLAVGSQEHVTLLDPRLSCTASAEQEFPSQDQDWGVRSLAFHDHIVTCGGGLGRVSFYDIRKKAFIPSNSNTTTSSSSSSSPSLLSSPPLSDTFCSVSSGWLDESSSIYQTYFHGQHRLMPQAVYTLEYSPDDSGKLFTAGGPIQSSLRGCYAALWS
ncbi:WD40-repeat-containing domain protein [Zychaea mexicana]|uniref:WD40-repeat-containing domain protein n=1 Tax=Zychaea mexicana TaxID=64656 RepID=UPI0022FE41FD|nr:WD40-repeat-containing domain protein [Zychaea mexicana]KAI9497003.1 WD40-repeat-containing domain protein [Zychaea mexicana]